MNDVSFSLVRFSSLAALVCAFAGCTTVTTPSAPEKNDAKNIYDIRWQTLPAACETLVTDDFDSWDFNFRPYGRTSDLWTDPAIIRGVSSGTDVKPSATAVRVSCDENGWSYLVYCAEPDADKTIASGGKAPLPNLEMYFMEKDTDNQDPALYWQFYTEGGKLEQYDWMSEDGHWRLLEPYVRHEVRRARGGYVFRLDVPWEAIWDRLPVFGDRNDNFWRLQIMRWVGGGITWGGEVHEPARAGYIRWPEFTEARKLAILQKTLEKAWIAYKAFDGKARYSTLGTGSTWSSYASVRTEKYAVEQAKAEGPRTYVSYSEDPSFRPELDRLHAERDALGAGIASFAAMSPAERDAFYKKAAPMLFNYRLAIEAAYAAHLKNKLLKGDK